MTKIIVNIVNLVLIMKRLKVFLFILFLLLVILVFNSIFNFVCIDEKILAAYMIGLSALFASTVAMINMRNNYIEKVLDKTNVVSTSTHHLIVVIDVLLNKHKTFLEILKGEYPLDEIMLQRYKDLFNSLSSSITDKSISQYIQSHNSKIFYNVHNDIFFILSYIDSLLKMIDNQPNINGTIQKIFKEEQFILFDKTIKNIKLLRVEIVNIKDKESKIHKKLYKEESF